VRIPDAWVDDLARVLDPEAFASPKIIHLSLTHRMGLTQRLEAINATLADVQADLANGFGSDRRNGSDGDYYCLSGTRFDVYVSPQPETETGLPLAVVTSVKPVQRLVNRDGFASPTVSFHLPYEKETCDVADIHQAMERQRGQRQRQRRARARAGDVLARPLVDGMGFGHSELHAQALRQYSTLLTVIDLLKERSETEDVVRVSGIVLDSSEVPAAADESLICINLDRAVESFRQGLEVVVRLDDHSWTLEVVLVEDRLLCVEPPKHGDLASGARVRVEYQEAFRLKRHSLALMRFREEDVVGDWTALTRLLCAPGTLAAPTARSTLTYFDQNLNRQQRAAVAGAVDAPHAFFVQGPPGTGKTTVITEIVRQLVGRGERVLLVASMHVAVDEVLRRVAEADGVFALRYSVNDSKVRDDLRRFLPEQVTAEFARQAARPAQSKAPRWQAEIDRLTDEESRLRAALTARAGHREAVARQADAIRAREEFQSGYRASMASADSAASLAKQRRAEAEARWAEAWHIERTLDAELAAVKAGLNFWGRIVRVFGGGPVPMLQQRYDAAWQALTKAHVEHETLASAVARAIAHQEAVAYRGMSGLQLHDQACARHAGQVHTAEQQLSQAHEAIHVVLPETDPAQVGDGDLAADAEQRRTRADRLQRYVQLEQRWHQIVGLTHHSPTGVEQVLTTMGEELLQAANLVCCTTTGFGGQPGIRDTDFDTIIVDEASRVIDSEFLIGARQARRWILVGDEHQLPPYVHSPDEHYLHALAALHMTERGAAPDLKSAVDHLSVLWRDDEELHQFRTDPVQKAAERLRDNGQWLRKYRPKFQAAYERLGRDDPDADRALLSAMRTHLVQSLFERCIQACPPGLREQLTEQRRMIDPIAAIVRDPVYRGHYHSPSPEDLFRHGVFPLVGETLKEPVVLLDTSDQPKAEEVQCNTGFINRFEADWAVQVCRLWERELRRRGGQDRVTASVLTLYGAQARLIREKLDRHYPEFRALKIEKIDSIDAIQGQESDLVLLSFCRTRHGSMGEGFGLWLQDVRRLNVACTRARRSLVLIGHRRTLERLSTIDEAKAFYSHLFGLFDQKSPGTVVLRDLRRSL
jgi:hypothetical protein